MLVTLYPQVMTVMHLKTLCTKVIVALENAKKIANYLG
jgi:hypothetical protein